MDCIAAVITVTDKNSRKMYLNFAYLSYAILPYSSVFFYKLMEFFYSHSRFVQYAVQCARVYSWYTYVIVYRACTVSSLTTTITFVIITVCDFRCIKELRARKTKINTKRNDSARKGFSRCTYTTLYHGRRSTCTGNSWPDTVIFCHTIPALIGISLCTALEC